MKLRLPHRPVEGEPYAHPFRPLCFGGMHAGPYVIEAPPGRTAVLGIVLTPLGAYRVLGRPLGELSGFTLGPGPGDRTGGGGAGGPAGRGTRRRRTGRPCACVATGAVASGPSPDPAVAWAAAQIERGGALRIAALRDERGIDETRFGRRFREQIGVAPKRFASLVRARNAVELLGDERLSLAEVAAAAGYYDQSHFGNEMRAFTGLSPREYRAAQRYPGAAGIAEPGPRAEVVVA
ncbi:MAG: helix-turn-helix domain-containing protein [Vulcanimicrobiaceae bacterium]